MDILHGPDFGPDDFGPDDQPFDTGEVVSAPPPVIGQDERRMQVRAYNYWASLLGKRRFPAPDRMLAGELPDFASHAVLLHFDSGLADPTTADPQIVFMGEALAAESGEIGALARLSDVPGRSAVSRITDHYLQIIANEAPIGFEAEFVNQRGATILYRGILLPMSSDDRAIDYICGVINWKELADQATTDELMRAIGATLTSPTLEKRKSPAHVPAPVGEWADMNGIWADGPVSAELGEDGFGDGPVPLDLDPYFDAPAVSREPTLIDWLEKARASAARARACDDRTRAALYAAIGRAWDFALSADHAPDDFARLVKEAGLVVQERAPLIPLLKLVFGADYDKTRLTEFATVLAHARRIGLGSDSLADYLAQAPGGLKALLAAERAARRGETARTAPATDWRAHVRAMPVRPLSDIAADGAEFALIMVRRSPGRGLAMLGEIADDAALLARAARHLGK